MLKRILFFLHSHIFVQPVFCNRFPRELTIQNELIHFLYSFLIIRNEPLFCFVFFDTMTTPLTSIRYERRLLASGTAIDRYNALSSSHFTTANNRKRNNKNSNYNNSYHNNNQSLEYWTNGTTTLLLNPCDTGETLGSSSSSSSSSRMTTPIRDGNQNSHRTGDATTTATARTGRGKVAPTQQQQQKPDQQQHVVRNSLLAGSIAGVVSTLVCHPFDVVRTKMQSAVLMGSSSSSSTTTTATTSTTATRTGPLHVVSQTWKHGGIRALYTGLTLPLAAQAVYKATIFTVNNVTQTALMNFRTRERLKTGRLEPYSLTMADRFVCGCVAGGVNAALFVTPVEFVRNQLIGQHTRRAAGQTIAQPMAGPLDVIRQTIYPTKNSKAASQTTTRATTTSRRFGILGLWRGVGVTMARDSLGCGCFFYAMAWSQQEFAKAAYNGAGDDHPPTPTLGVTIVSGALAGLAYWLVALPLDAVKTWVQSDMADSAVQAVQTSWRERGPLETMKRLTSGYQVAYARGIPSAAITVTSYSFCYTALQRMDP